MTPPGPVSTTLEAELRERVRSHGIVLWLDRDAQYLDFVTALAARRAASDLPYAVHAWRGSHLALMLELEELAGGLDRSHLLVHLPGFIEEAVRRTPLLELYAPGVRFRKKLATLVTEAAAGEVAPEQIAAYLDQGPSSLADADAWLAALLVDEGGGLATQLRAMTPLALVDDLLSGGFVAGRLGKPGALEALWRQLGAWTGLPEPWREAALPAGSLRPSDLAFVAASWALVVEYVDDLDREPVEPRIRPAAALPGKVAQTCRALAAHLRDRHPTFYEQTADETQGWLEEEIGLARAEELGQIDTFRFEEDRILRDALDALAEDRWAAALEWATTRIEGGSFWLRRDPARLAAWELVKDAAGLGIALEAAGIELSAESLEQALERYVAAGAAADRAHRWLEQRRAALLDPQLPAFEVLRVRLDYLRGLWREWADLWATDFNRLCRQRGFLPPPDLQQRTLFEQQVRPLTREPGTTALFLVDALRFEMGVELFEALRSSAGTSTQLRARFAELPTVTAVGMNALAPVEDHGRLRPHLSGGGLVGFSTGEFRVHDPDTRRRAMADRAGGATCPGLTLVEVLGRDTTGLRRSISRAKLVVVHSGEIDKAGEVGAGPRVFDSVMQDLRAAWRLLREAGVSRFVITSDHGFLLLDDAGRRAITHGRRIDPSRRWVLSTVEADHSGEVRVALADLGYEGVDGHLMFPASAAVFDTGRRGGGFVHGGNSLQERVIPVLTVVHHRAAGADSRSYAASGEVREGVAGMHCLVGRLETTSQGALAFSGTRVVELGLRPADEPRVRVELCQVRGGGELKGGAVQAVVGQDFELFFKLRGPSEERVRVELHHPGALVTVEPCVLEARFAVTAMASLVESEPEPAPQVEADRGWLQSLPEGGVRQLFEHLAIHGTVTEAEAATMLGGPRAARRFARKFERYAAMAPFEARIASVAGVKRYLREGGEA